MSWAVLAWPVAFVLGFIACFIALRVGFVMGRQSIGQKDEKVKTFDPGPRNALPEDPYRQAFPDEGVIQTVEKEK